jgi:shikimate dehydrogenase
MGNQTGDLKSQFQQVSCGDFGIFGDPISHSLSPSMQGAALNFWWTTILNKKQENSPRYHAFCIKPHQLAEAFSLAQSHGIKGLNITVPHKEASIAYMTSLDSSAENIKAINTALLNDARWKGYNTDGLGFISSLKNDLGFNPKDKKILVLGAGGTGKVVVDQLVQAKAAKIYWWNRSLSKISGLYENHVRTGLIEVVKGEEFVGQACQSANLVINATSVGLKENEGLPVTGLIFAPDQFVLDVIYHRETELMKMAKKAKAAVMGGAGMLLYQGAASFEIWTGHSAPVELMKQTLLKTLNERGLSIVWQ